MTPDVLVRLKSKLPDMGKVNFEALTFRKW
jgi:hypothetical protein